MKISRRTLTKLERCYSIALLPGTERGRLSAFLCGSESDDSLLLFEPPGFQPRVIAKSPGGFISVWPLERDGRRYAIVSTLFKPGFDAARTVIRLYPLEAGECPPSTVIADLPYTHRVTVLPHGGRDYVLASTLCAAKANKEDWSQPGGIWLLEPPANISQPWPKRQIVPGLNKNHGLDFARLGRERRPGYFLSAMEGLFFLPIPSDATAAWPVELIDGQETSDAFAFDWDDDGEPEIFSISPFHGHVLAQHKKTISGWEKRVIHEDLAFGHIVWAGNFLGRPGLLAGSRRERRELRLYRRAADGSVDRNYALIDEGIGPSQISVVTHGADAATLYVAAHGVNEVRVYEIEA